MNKFIGYVIVIILFGSVLTYKIVIEAYDVYSPDYLNKYDK